VTKEEIEHQKWYHVGRASALEDHAKTLRKTAGEMFASSSEREDQARYIRQLAVSVEMQAKTERTEQKKLNDQVPDSEPSGDLAAALAAMAHAVPKWSSCSHLDGCNDPMFGHEQPRVERKCGQCRIIHELRKHGYSITEAGDVIPPRRAT